ncbi:MAG: hypothetical protein GYA80_03875 [Chloroflexi bacterium]|nr:hypothetical protein [Chloroflexota bacterium]
MKEEIDAYQESAQDAAGDGRVIKKNDQPGKTTWLIWLLGKGWEMPYPSGMVS